MRWLAALSLLLGASQERRGPIPAEEALGTFRLLDGWRIERVASEPLVVDPVAMAFDEDGRIYVAEMRDYPQAPVAGSIALLEDTDGDGLMDKRRPFADRIPLPTGVLPWRGGVLVTAAYEVLYLKDTDGDGRADERRTVLSGFGRQNSQHLLNGLQFGLDNWIYASNGLSGGTVNGVTLKGTDFRFRPDTGEVEPVSGNSQFGNTFDEWGRRFIVTHDNHLIHPVMPQRYLRKNPHLAVKAVQEGISDHGNIPRLFPASRRDTVFTTDTDSSCSVTIFRGQSFVCEPVLNLVHRDELIPKGASFTARRIDPEREFLASTDPWSRPVNLSLGPDGALYVVDMYRAVIEHPDYIPKEIQKKLDLSAGTDCGRIYRVTDRPAGPSPRLSRVSSAELVALLENENPWWRVTAQRMLIEREARSAAEALRSMAAASRSALARLHAARTLEGLRELLESDVLALLRDSEARVREHGIRMAEPFLAASGSLQDEVAALAEDADPRVRFQVALTAGEVGKTAALSRIARRDAADPWIRTAILASSGQGSPEILAAMSEETPGAVELTHQLALIVGRRNRGDEPIRWLRAAGKGGPTLGPLQRAALAVLGPLRSAGHDIFALLKQAGLEEPSVQWSLQALLTVARGDAPPPQMLEAVEVLALLPSEEQLDPLARLLDPRKPHEVQLAVIRRHGERLDRRLWEGWSRYTVPIRAAVLDIQLARPERVGQLLDLVEKGTIRAVDLAPHHRAELGRHPDGALRSRAKNLLAVKGSEDREEVIREVSTKVAKLTGDRARGEKVFTTSCAVCHRLQGKGTKVGPDLEAAIGRERPALLADLLDPNRAMDPSYQVYVVKTRSNETLNGVISAETPSSITLRRAAGEESTILRSNVEEMKAWPASLMPEGLESSLSGQEFADLLEFLRAK